MRIASVVLAASLVVVGGVFPLTMDFGSRSQIASAQQAALRRNENPVRVYGIPQVDCPVTIEQQENASDGSLRSMDFQNHGGEAIASLRVGWNIPYEDSAKAPDRLAGKVIDLRRALPPGARTTLSAREIGVAPIVEGAKRLELYVASGYFESGAKFTCSTATAKRE